MIKKLRYNAGIRNFMVRNNVKTSRHIHNAFELKSV